MNTHGTLTDYSVSHSLIDHIGKGREGKRKGRGGESYRDVSCGSFFLNQSQIVKAVRGGQATFGIGEIR